MPAYFLDPNYRVVFCEQLKPSSVLAASLSQSTGGDAEKMDALDLIQEIVLATGANQAQRVFSALNWA